MLLWGLPLNGGGVYPVRKPLLAPQATSLALLGSAADAQANLKRAIELRPESQPFKLQLAAALRQEGKLHESVAEIKAMMAAERSAKREPPAGCARLLSLCYNDIAMAAAARVGYEEALEWLAKAVEEPRAVFFLNQGDCHRELKRPAAALRSYERARELGRGEAALLSEVEARMSVLHNDAGARLFNGAQPTEAALAFSRAIECSPQAAELYLNRAECALQLSRHELVTDDVLAALRLDPQNARAKRMLASLGPS